MAKFFESLPNVYVASNNQATYFEESNVTYTKVKNFFRTSKIREDYQKYVTLFAPYYIPDNARPDNVAHYVYGDSTLDWAILMTNNILDVYTQWPKQFDELERYCIEMYGEEEMVYHHHWETLEIRDSNQNILLPSGIIVNETFRWRNPTTGIYALSTETKASISNYEHESFLNEKKKFIYIMDDVLLEEFISEFGSLSQYPDSDDDVYDEFGSPKTPLDSVGQYSYLESGRSIYPDYGTRGDIYAAASATKAFLEEVIEQTPTGFGNSSNYSGLNSSSISQGTTYSSVGSSSTGGGSGY
jgi:hypothetical protein